MARKCARTFSIVVEKGKKSILEVRHLLPVGIARYVRRINFARTDSVNWKCKRCVFRTGAARTWLYHQAASARRRESIFCLFRRDD